MRTLLKRLHQRVSDLFYNLILFMNENEQNIENWQIKINNFSAAIYVSTVSKKAVKNNVRM